MNTVGTPLLWGGFAVVVTIMLAIDLLLLIRLEINDRE